jgi:hypothetical protein
MLHVKDTKFVLTCGYATRRRVPRESAHHTHRTRHTKIHKAPLRYPRTHKKFGYRRQRGNNHTTITPRAASLGDNQKDNMQIQSTSQQKATTARLITKCKAATMSTKNAVPAITVASVRRRSRPLGRILIHRHDSPALPLTASATLTARSDVVWRTGRIRVHTCR